MNLLLILTKIFFLFPRIEVAIKEATSPSVKDEMLDEAKAMVRVSKHDHIVNIQGKYNMKITLMCPVIPSVALLGYCLFYTQDSNP